MIYKNKLEFWYKTLVILIIVNISQCQKSGFIATFPSSVLPNTTAKFCIRFQNIDSEIILTIEDESPKCFETTEKTIAKDASETCINVKISSEIKETKQKKITVKGYSRSGSYKFEDSKIYTTKTVNSFTLIETDKPVYKPKDKVRIRLLTLDYELKPLQKIHNLVFITDSSGSRVSQWLDLDNKNGLVSLEMPLSEEPNLGTWSIEVSNDGDMQNNIKAKFEVKKYVLPKFEVAINHNKKIKSTEKKVDVNVCGKYSHGNNVKGLFELEAFTKQFSYKTYREDIFKNITKSIKGSGCIEFDFDLLELGVQPTNYMNKIYFKAKLIESETNIEANASSSIEISYASLDIEIVEPNYYKPGFPINFKLLIKNVDGNGMSNEEIEIKLERDGANFYMKNYFSDENGYIEFTINPMSITFPDIFTEPGTIYLKATQKNRKPDSNTYNVERVFPLTTWLSLTNSYIQIYKPKLKGKTLNCDQMISNEVILRSPKQIKGNIYFQLQAKSEIILSGHYNTITKETKTSDDNKSFGFKFEAKSERLEKLSENKAGQARPKSCDQEILFSENEPTPSISTTTFNDEAKMYPSYNFVPRIIYKWYYDKKTNTCKKILKQTTPENNSNKFDSKRLCEDACKMSPSYSIIAQLMTNKNFKTKEIYEYTYDLTFNVASEMSPKVNVLVFFTDDQEIISDSVSYKIDECFKNEVELFVDFDVIQIGKRVELTVKSDPKSICAISAIDKSVSFMGARNSIQTQKIFEELSKFETLYDEFNTYPTFDNQDCEDDSYYPMPRPIPLQSNRPITARKRMIYRPYESKFYDSTKAFRDSKIIYLSDFKIYRECVSNIFPIYYARSNVFRKFGPQLESFAGADAWPLMSAPAPGEAKLSSINSLESIVIETVRQYFPETWLWDIYQADEEGLITKTERVPDSITDWIIDSYCVSPESGIGISPTKTLKVFQPLFVSIDLPYSVIRTETFQVKASVFNFEKTCIPVQIELESDRRLALNKESSNNIKTCICADDKITHKFDMTALSFELDKGLSLKIKVSSINESGICNITSQPVTKTVRFYDSETRSVLVEPEGIPKEHTESYFAVFKSTQVLSNQSIDINIPKNVVPRSTRGYLSITGDSMGPILNNLDKLVQQPTGCGEQNMVKFAPIKSVVSYLKDTYQLTQKMSDLTQEYLKIGYQRQLTYRHKDGSFSAFGPSDAKQSGGTWLTSFVLRVFAETYKLKHINIDEKDILLSLKMLMNTQNSEGCFQQVGAPLYSKALSGGLKDQKVGLSAYVLVSVLKAIDALELKNNSEYDSKVNLGLNFLKSSVENLENADTYTLGLILFSFELANINDEDFISKLNNEINKRAIRENGFTYWTESGEKKSEEDSSKSNWQINQSADLEITSYILLSKLYNNKNKDLSSIVPIAKWINSQRNSMGGFYSTQDTCIALDALSEFASAFYSKNIDLKLTYNYNNNKNTVFVNDKNRLLVQKINLKRLKESDKNTLNFDIEGNGTALVQVILKYNLIDEVINKQESFEFSIFSSTSVNCDKAELTIKARYIGKSNASSMAIIALRLPTGWIADEASIEKLRNQVDLKRYEVNENKVHLYFDELNHSAIEFNISVIKKFEIKNSMPGLISVYDYYEPLDESTTQLFEIHNECN